MLLMLRLVQSEISILILLTTLGSIVLISADDLLSIYVCLELQTLAIFILVAKRHGSIISPGGGGGGGGLNILFYEHCLQAYIFLKQDLSMLRLKP